MNPRPKNSPHPDLVSGRTGPAAVWLGLFCLAWASCGLPADQAAPREKPAVAKSVHHASPPIRIDEPAPAVPDVLPCGIPSFPRAAQIGFLQTDADSAPAVRLCQALGPAAPYAIDGVDSACTSGCGEPTWDCRGPLPWQVFAQGEYVGPARTRHVPIYRLRVDDEMDLIYRLTRNETSQPYELNVGDQIRVESITDTLLDRDLIIQPDGTITLRLLGQVHAARLTVEQLRSKLEKLYAEYYKTPSITVTPIKVNTKLDDLRATVDSRYGFGGQSLRTRISPDGTIQLPALGAVPAQGLTMDELQREIDRRYAEVVDGIGVTPVLLNRAPRYVFVVGEVRAPGRFTLEGPTTVMQAIALAGGWNNGGNIRQVVVFRRAEDWRLMATKLDLSGALYGKKPCPADEIWVRDCDIVVVPKSSILLATDFIELVFTRGIYGVLPFQGVSLNFSKLSSI